MHNVPKEAQICNRRRNKLGDVSKRERRTNTSMPKADYIGMTLYGVDEQIIMWLFYIYSAL